MKGGCPLTEATYTTSQGETWDVIAKRIWGEERLMHKLIEANPAYQETVFFSAGIVLTVPAVETPAKVLNLPPWKRK